MADKDYAKHTRGEWEGGAKKLTSSVAAYKAKKREANRKAKKAAALSKRRNRKK